MHSYRGINSNYYTNQFSQTRPTTPIVDVIPVDYPLISTTIQVPSPPLEEKNTTLDHLRIAAIMDDITYNCFKYDCQILLLSKRNFRQELSNFNPHLLFVESAWNGNNDTWKGSIAHCTIELIELINFCKALNIPTIFWAKDDSPQYTTFIHAAKLFDFIYTTDESCVPRYKQDTGNPNVNILMFGIQPKLHNPIRRPRESKLNTCCFAGIYYATKFAKRQAMFDALANPCIKYGLDIYNRFSSLPNSPDYKYPDEYSSCLKGFVPYDQLISLYKLYDIVVNLNTVTDSYTMFSRRIFDALACGTCILSNSSLGMEKLFGDTILVSHSKQETTNFLEYIHSNPIARDKLAAKGLGQVIHHHKYSDRLRQIVDDLSIPLSLSPPPTYKVSVVVCTKRNHMRSAIFENFIKQTYSYKELIIVLNNDQISLQEWEHYAKNYPDYSIRIYKLPESTPLGACLNYGFDHAQYDILLKMDDDDLFTSHFIEDELIFFDYTTASILGKNSFFVYFEGSKTLAIRYPNREYMSTNIVAGSSMLFKREVYDQVRFNETLNVSEIADFLKNAKLSGFEVFSTHKFNHAVIRRQDVMTHTWHESESTYLARCSVVTSNISDSDVLNLIDLHSSI